MAKTNPREYLEKQRPGIERSLAILKSKQTAVPPHSEPVTDGKDEAYVDDGALVSFMSKVSGQQKQDVLNVTLLAQLAANADADRFKDTEAWYRKYIEVLENTGWVIQNFDFQRYQTHQDSFTVDNSLLDILKSLLSRNQYIIIERTLESLKGPENAPWWEVFNSSSTSGDNGNFQISPCEVDESGQVVMTLGAFHFKASQSSDRWFWFVYKSSSMKFFRSCQVCTLNEAIYAEVRDLVKDMLGSHAHDYLGKLKLKI